MRKIGIRYEHQRTEKYLRVCPYELYFFDDSANDLEKRRPHYHRTDIRVAES